MKKFKLLSIILLCAMAVPSVIFARMPSNPQYEQPVSNQPEISDYNRSAAYHDDYKQKIVKKRHKAHSEWQPVKTILGMKKYLVPKPRTPYDPPHPKFGKPRR